MLPRPPSTAPSLGPKPAGQSNALRSAPALLVRGVGVKHLKRLERTVGGCLSSLEIPHRPILRSEVKMNQAPTSVGACVKVMRIGGLTAATEQQWQNAQNQESEYGGFGNHPDNLNIAAKRAVVDDALLKIAHRQEWAVNAIG